jgi:hypothetical protein
LVPLGVDGIAVSEKEDAKHQCVDDDECDGHPDCKPETDGEGILNESSVEKEN